MSWFFKEDHIIEMIGKRCAGVEVDEHFNRIKDALSQSIPDEWRLTRFSPDFLIRDLVTGITLVGHQTGRGQQEGIDKHVNTALYQGGFSKAKVGKFSHSPDAYDIARRPNIFIGDPDIHQLFRVTPVLARQYEKVYYIMVARNYSWKGKPYQCRGRAKVPIEYFRLHPLGPTGVNRNRYTWLEWNTASALCEFIEGEPPSDFHGEDWWALQVQSRW